MKKKSITKPKHIKKDVGLLILMVSFAIAFFATAPVVFELNNQVVRTMFAISQAVDEDRDGVANEYDVNYNKSLTFQDVENSKQKTMHTASEDEI